MTRSMRKAAAQHRSPLGQDADVRRLLNRPIRMLVLGSLLCAGMFALLLASAVPADAQVYRQQCGGERCADDRWQVLFWNCTSVNVWEFEWYGEIYTAVAAPNARTCQGGTQVNIKGRHKNAIVRAVRAYMATFNDFNFAGCENGWCVFVNWEE